MLKEEIFENRRAIAKKICQDIRANGGRMTKAKYFSERPYCYGEKSYKFSTANFLRLLSSDNEVIRKRDPRWLCIDEIKNNGWSVRKDAMPELLEIWNRDGEQECFLNEFYNATDILQMDSFQRKNQSLETVLKFFQERGLLAVDKEIISLQDALDAIKKYAEYHGANELTSILSAQT